MTEMSEYDIDHDTSGRDFDPEHDGDRDFDRAHGNDHNLERESDAYRAAFSDTNDLDRDQDDSARSDVYSSALHREERNTDDDVRSSAEATDETLQQHPGARDPVSSDKAGSSNPFSQSELAGEESSDGISRDRQASLFQIVCDKYRQVQMEGRIGPYATADGASSDDSQPELETYSAIEGDDESNSGTDAHEIHEKLRHEYHGDQEALDAFDQHNNELKEIFSTDD